MIRRPSPTTVLVLFSYKDGYPIAVYADVDSAPQYPEPWREVPCGWGGRGGWATHDHDGAALDLVRCEVVSNRPDLFS